MVGGASSGSGGGEVSEGREEVGVVVAAVEVGVVWSLSDGEASSDGGEGLSSGGDAAVATVVTGEVVVGEDGAEVVSDVSGGRAPSWASEQAAIINTAARHTRLLLFHRDM
ncbi:MAG: hypothetical protein OXQ32_04315 [bacterium]|nr:hypothetical protein [bacterium]